MFQVAVFTVLEIERFYDYLKEQYKDESAPVEELQSFGNRYQYLSYKLNISPEYGCCYPRLPSESTSIVSGPTTIGQHRRSYTPRNAGSTSFRRPVDSK